jgi:hypothetical protein
MHLAASCELSTQMRMARGCCLALKSTGTIALPLFVDEESLLDTDAVTRCV